VSLQLAGARARGPDPRLEDDLDAPIVRPGLVRLRDWGGGDGRGKLRINLLSLDIKSLMYWSGGGVVGTQPAIKASGSGALPVGEGLARGWRGGERGARVPTFREFRGCSAGNLCAVAGRARENPRGTLTYGSIQRIDTIDRPLTN
jgi:hypothetical protein